MGHHDTGAPIPSADDSEGVPTGGHADGLAHLLPLVYSELKAMAHRRLRHEREGHTLNTTALVHEAYMKLGAQTGVPWSDRAHFLGIAARAMRQVLVDSARRHASGKRGGSWRRVPLEEASVSVAERADALLALDDALDRLAQVSERMSRIVLYRFYGGMTEAETATALGISERTARREWTKAKLWLHAELSDPVGSADGCEA